MGLRNEDTKFWIRPTEEESEKLKDLKDRLVNKCGVSSKRFSELSMQYILEGFENLVRSLEGNTQTFSHDLSSHQEKLQIIDKILAMVEKKPMEFERAFSFFFNRYKDYLGGDLRTYLKWFLRFLENDKLVVLNIRDQGVEDYYLIPKGSFWHAQFKNHCFSFPSKKINFQPGSEVSAKKKLRRYLNEAIPFPEEHDKISRFVAICFKNHLQEEERPMYPEPIYREIIELRSQWKHSDAKKLLKEEIKHKQAQVNKVSLKKLQAEADALLDYKGGWPMRLEETLEVSLIDKLRNRDDQIRAAVLETNPKYCETKYGISETRFYELRAEFQKLGYATSVRDAS